MTFDKIYHFAIGIFLLIFLNFERLTSLALIPLILTIIYGIVTKKLKWHPQILLLIFPALYLFYFIGFFFTNHPDIASKYLEYKLSFLIFPLIFCFKPIFKIRLNIISFYYLIGLLLALLICLYFGWKCYNETQLLNCAFSSNISEVHHPTYLSAFLYLGMVILIYALHSKWKYYSASWVIPSLIVLILAQFLLLSLAGVLLLIATGFVYFSILIFRKFGTIQKILALTLLIIIICSLFFIPKIKHDFTGTWQYTKEFIENPKDFVESRKAPISGSETRLCLWTASVLCIYDHPFGLGTGNIDEVLKSKLISLNRPEIAALNYNPHNQFLQTTLELGIIVLIFLLFAIVLLIRFSVKYRNYILLLLVINLTFNMFFESMLQRQSGIVFFTFWICLLILIQNQKVLKIKKEKFQI